MASVARPPPESVVSRRKSLIDEANPATQNPGYAPTSESNSNWARQEANRVSQKFSAIMAVVTGAAFAILFICCWTYIGIANPLPAMLVKNGLTGTGFWTTITATDFLINIILFLPGAWILWRLGARHIRVNTVLALLSFSISGALTAGLPLFSYGARVWITYALLLASLPLAVWLLSRFASKVPDNSCMGSSVKQSFPK